MIGFRKIVWQTMEEMLGERAEGMTRATKTKDVFKDKEELFNYVTILSNRFGEMFGTSIEKEFDEVSAQYIFGTMGHIWFYFIFRLDA